MDADIKETVLEYWEKRSVTFDFETDRELVRAWTRALSPYIPAGKQKVLDIGTGPGFMASIAAGMGHEVTGIDFSKAMLKRAGENAGALGLSIDFVLADAGNLPFEENAFDVIISRNVLWNILEPEKALLQWKRVLKTSGRLIYFDGNYYRYLFDERENEKRRQFILTHEAYRLRLAEVAEKSNISFADMEKAAYTMPLSKASRPHWDVETLSNMGFSILTAEDVADALAGDIENLPPNNRFFMIAAEKNG